MKTLVEAVLDDTIAARMLRTLCERGEMTQADFMKLYHVRCERPHPSVSSFGNQFWRFVWTSRNDSGNHRETRKKNPLRCIEVSAISPKKNRKPQNLYRDRIHYGRKLLRWVGPNAQELVASIDDKKIAKLHELIDYQLGFARKTDDTDETARWVLLVRTELRRRSLTSAISPQASLTL